MGGQRVPKGVHPERSGDSQNGTLEGYRIRRGYKKQRRVRATQTRTVQLPANHEIQVFRPREAIRSFRAPGFSTRHDIQGTNLLSRAVVGVS